MACMVATKAALSIRVNALTDSNGKSEDNAASIGVENRAKLESRLRALEHQLESGITGQFSQNNHKQQARFSMSGETKTYNTKGDLVDFVSTQRENPMEAAVQAVLSVKEVKKRAKEEKKAKRKAKKAKEKQEDKMDVDEEDEQERETKEDKKDKKRKRRESDMLPTAEDEPSAKEETEEERRARREAKKAAKKAEKAAAAAASNDSPKKKKKKSEYVL